MHGPKADIGWTGNWGMAASAEEKDYVHVLARSIAAITGTRPVTRIENLVDFERHYDTYDVGPQVQKAREFKADTVIVAIGQSADTAFTISTV